MLSPHSLLASSARTLDCFAWTADSSSCSRSSPISSIVNHQPQCYVLKRSRRLILQGCQLLVTLVQSHLDCAAPLRQSLVLLMRGDCLLLRLIQLAGKGFALLLQLLGGRSENSGQRVRAIQDAGTSSSLGNTWTPVVRDALKGTTSTSSRREALGSDPRPS